ncbi:MAG: threonine/serine exporter family protein [Clostridiales bacterium]|nr:threonine/serine exporter family protein [Clostridiales bacterium]
MKKKKSDGYQIMDVAVKAGAIMLANGAETYRVEDTINHILKLYPHTDSSSLVIATGIIVTLYEEDKKPITVVRRIRRRNVNLNMIYKVNTLSRQLCAGVITPQEAEQQLDYLRFEKQYGAGLNAVGIIGVSSSFTILVGGTLLDACFAVWIGIALALILVAFRNTRITNFFQTMLAATAVAVMARAFLNFVPFELHDGPMVVGSIMPLLPGMTFTNAIRDILYGDYTAGLARMTEAVLVASAVALGVGFGIVLFRM